MNPLQIAAVKLIDLLALPRLAPQRPRTGPAELLQQIDAIVSAAGIDRQSAAGVALGAGLLQWHDYLDESHVQAQSIEGEWLGDCWHAIMHRREPDYGNAKYWFRRVGRPEHFQTLGPQASHILAHCPDPTAARWAGRLTGAQSEWNALAFVDLCEACAQGEETPLGLAAREIQRLEMRLLLERTCDHAVARRSLRS